MNTFEDELKELKAIFGVKKILSPADIAPILGHSVPVLANMRLSGACPLPVYKIGRSVGFNIRDVAQFLATGSVCPSKSAPEQKSSASLQIRTYTRKATLTQQKSWLLAMQDANRLNEELLTGIERVMLANIAKTTLNKTKSTGSTL
jgi:hypothetical protein